MREARRMATEALRRGYAGIEQSSTKWWQTFWAVSSVRVPDPKIQAQYDLAMYLYGAGRAPRRPSYSAPGFVDRRRRWLAAVEGRLPPRPQHAAHVLAISGERHWDQGQGLLDFLWHQLPATAVRGGVLCHSRRGDSGRGRARRHSAWRVADVFRSHPRWGCGSRWHSSTIGVTPATRSF